MILVSPVIALFFVAFIHFPAVCESLKCYQCFGNELCGQEETEHIVDCAGICMSYLNGGTNGTIVRRCCTDDCDNTNGNQAYFCTNDKCNDIQSDRELFVMKNQILKKPISLKAGLEEDTTSSSISCYDCSAHNTECGISAQTLVHGCQKCMIYLNTYDNNNAVRRCCTSGCGSSDGIGEFDGRNTYFCSSNQCNNIEAEKVLTDDIKSESVSTMSTTPSSTQTTTSATTMTTTSKTSFECYECSGLNEQPCTTTAVNCPMCMVSHNADDPTKFDRRCCWWGCGTPNQITEYAGRPTYFCNADKCNGPGSEAPLGYATTTTSRTTTAISTVTATTITMTITTEQSSSQCFDCSGPECGREDSSMSMNCPKCMVYRNPTDQTIIERRCCWWSCGPSNTISTYNGLETYFCAGNRCNGYGAEYALSPAITTTSITTITMTTTPSSTTITTTTTTTATTATTESSSSQCFDCSGPECGREDSSMAMHCPKCMVYRNPTDQTIIERRCCWWSCGPSNSISTYNGMETYFCTGNKCNGYGTEYALSPPVTTTTTATTTGIMVITTTRMTTMLMTTTTATTTITTTATTEPPSSQCYDCSGPECGREGSSMVMNCPKCIVHRNPIDQTKIERRCCWWGCGPSNSVGTHSGMETYFCTGNKCNGYGAEYALSPPVTTTSVSTITMPMTTSMTITSSFWTTTTTPSPANCVLNCQNGGTLETEDGCFCYCLENTNGRECENVDCAQPDVSSDICNLENQSLCEESETFAFECLHLCGKC